MSVPAHGIVIKEGERGVAMVMRDGVEVELHLAYDLDPPETQDFQMDDYLVESGTDNQVAASCVWLQAYAPVGSPCRSLFYDPVYGWEHQLNPTIESFDQVIERYDTETETTSIVSKRKVAEVEIIPWDFDLKVVQAPAATPGKVVVYPSYRDSTYYNPPKDSREEYAADRWRASIPADWRLEVRGGGGLVYSCHPRYDGWADPTGHDACSGTSTPVGPGSFVAELLDGEGNVIASSSGSSSGPQPPDTLGGSNPAAPDVVRTCAGKPINCESGNQYEIQSDLATGGRGVGLGLTRTYNSQSAAKSGARPGAFGLGWTGSFSDRVDVSADGDVATVRHANGSSVDFTLFWDGRTTAPTQVKATLAREGNGTWRYVLPDQTVMTFAADGRLTTVADGNANTTRLTYDAAARLSKVVDPAGRAMTLTYNTGGQVASATDPTGLRVDYAYSAGNLSAVTYAGAAAPRWRFGYDGAHQLTSMTDGSGGVTTTAYDAAHRAIRQVDALKRTRTWQYLASETRITNPSGSVTRHVFAADRQPLSTTSGFGTAAAATQSKTYNADGFVASETDGNGRRTTYAYDGAGNRVSATDPNGRTTAWTYDGKRNVTSVKLPSGRTTTVGYDAKGNPTSASSTLTRPNLAPLVQRSTTTYDAYGQATKVTDALGRSATMRYDAAGNLIEQVEPTGAKTTWAYDAGSRLTATVSPRGYVAGATAAAYTTVITRDRFGRAIATRDPLARTTSTTYDALDRPVRVVDGENRATVTTIDAEGQVTKQVRGGVTRSWTYDLDGRVLKRLDGTGRATTTVFDAAGRPTSTTDPLGRVSRQAYDKAGRPTVATDALGRTTTTSYDAASQVTKVDYSDAGTPDVTFAYDVDGRRTKMIDGSGTSTFAYDTLDRLTSVQSGAGKTVGYGYDLGDQQTQVTYPNGKAVKRTFDVGGRMTALVDWLGNTTAFDYDLESNQLATRFPSATGNADRASYDAAGQLKALTMVKGATTTSSLGLTYDKSGRRTAATATGLPAGPKAFAYDTAGRLVKADASPYAYDAAGNATQLGTGTALTYDAAGQLTSMTAAAKKTTYAFGDLGERVLRKSPTGAVTEYGYDQTGALTSVDPAPAPQIAYRFDGEGKRVGRSRNGVATTYTWDASGDLALLLWDGATSFLYGPDGKPIEQISAAGVATFLHTDDRGDVRSLTDKAGATVATFSWDAYGNATGRTGTVTTPFGYAGEFRDADTGLIHLRAREYDPATGQFLTRDPLESETGEPYLYGSGDPVNRADPTGEAPEWLSGAAGSVSETSAGYLHGWSFGYSTELAGSLFGFDAGCADFGPGFTVGQGLSFVGPGAVVHGLALGARGTLAGGKVLLSIGRSIARDETGGVGKLRRLGNLASRADEKAADVIRSRGGGADQVQMLESGYGELTLRELAQRAETGDEQARIAIKMAKQAGSQKKGGK